mgnify:CR=1 FL=1
MGKLEARHVPENALPVIDISGLRSADSAVRKSVGDEIRAACLDLGFMYIVGHGVSAETRSAVFAETAAFFALPEERKLALDMKNSVGNAGYEPMRAQTLETGGGNSAMRENQTMDRCRSAQSDRLNRPRPRCGGGVALSLRLEEDFFADFCTEPLAGLRLLHYPPQPANAHPDEKGCGAHTDFGGITMLMQDDNGGLQVMGADGEWLHAPPMADSYIVNLGDMVARWTNDTYRSTLHRVVNFSGRERYSIPFFYSGRLSHEVAALPGCLPDGQTAKYPPTTVEAHMRDMYARTYV